MLKKIIFISFLLLMQLGLVSCGNQSSGTGDAGEITYPLEVEGSGGN